MYQIRKKNAYFYYRRGGNTHSRNYKYRSLLLVLGLLSLRIWLWFIILIKKNGKTENNINRISQELNPKKPDALNEKHKYYGV
jgi:hypothetical protein